MAGKGQAVGSQEFEKKVVRLIESSAEAHGHLCPGQVVGVRMALLGGRLIGLDVPAQGRDIKKIIVYVEMDRCTADAVAHTTGVKLGRRSLKHVDYGIMAATFINLETGRAFRIISTEESRDLTDVYAPEIGDPAERRIEAYRRMPDEVLFRIQEVEVELSEYDLPGPTRKKVVCRACGQVVRDNREVVVNGWALCRPCAGQGYFRVLREVNGSTPDAGPASEIDHEEPRLTGRGRA